MTQVISPETQAKLAQWRAKALDGTLTLEEMKEAVKFLRGDRIGAAHASAASKRKRAIAEIPSADDLISELGA